MTLAIVDYKKEYQPYFEKLNNAWLEEYFSIEPIDKYVLQNPEEAIIKDGGKIYFVTENEKIIGTVALRVLEPNIFEMTKMAVAKESRGDGAGKLLCLTAIEKVKELKAKKLVLYSTTVLETAICIYRALGFVEVPLEPGMYKRANIKMEIVF